MGGLKRSPISFFLIPLLLIIGCSRIEDIDTHDSDYQEQLCIQCLLCPQQDSILTMITKTPMWDQWIEFGSSEYWVKNAKVTLSSVSQGNIVLNQTARDLPVYGVSQKEYAIQSGNTYQITVEVPGFEQVLGQTTVPELIATWSSFDTLFRYSKNTDIGEADFIVFSGSWESTSPDNRYSVYLNITTEEWKNQFVLSPGNYVEKSRISQIDLKYSFVDDQYFSDTDYPWFALGVLITGNPEYNMYIQAFINQQTSVEYSDDWESYLRSSLIPINYSNVQGGIGIFAAYQYDLAQIALTRGK